MDQIFSNPYLNVAIRSLAVYLFILIAIRLSGKKELSQLNTTDVVLILLISNAVQNAMVGANTSLSSGLVAAAVLFTANYVIKRILFNNKKLSDLISEHPEILVHNGTLNTKTLEKLGISNDELEEAMREHGVENFADVKLAMLEIDGNISIIAGDNNKSLTQTHHKRRAHKTLGSVN
ncbi:MAG TPA: YetF domain-containing protein [Aquirhabdus sp.]